MGAAAVVGVRVSVAMVVLVVVVIVSVAVLVLSLRVLVAVVVVRMVGVPGGDVALISIVLGPLARSGDPAGGGRGEFPLRLEE